MREALPSPPSYLRVLDGIRGVAILLVVLPHLALAGGLFAPSIVQRAIEAVGHGVDIFFVLSGFCLALPILLRQRSGEAVSMHLPTFYFNRAFRILPMYYVATAGCLFVNVLFVAGHHNLPATLALPHSFWSAFAPLVFLDRNVDPVNATFWSLAVQLRWYLVFPLLMAIYLFSRRLFCALTIGAWIAYYGTRLHSLDLGTLPLFMLGIIAADLFVVAHPWRRFAIWLIPAAMLLGHLSDRWATIPDAYGNELHWTMQPTTLGWQLAAFFFVVAATENRALGSILRSAPFVLLGIASFSIYLFHEPVIELWVALLGGRTGLIGGLVAVGIGILLWYIAERPLCNAALRRLLRENMLPRLENVLGASNLTGNVVFARPSSAVENREPARARVPLLRDAGPGSAAY